VILMKQKQKKT